MAHEIGKRDIQVGLAQAWHGKTIVVDCIDKTNAGFLYPMALHPIRYNWGQEGEQRYANGRQIVSCDDGLPVGAVVGARYALIPNSAIFDAVMEGVAGTGHKVVSCGTVRDRSLAFLSLKVAETFRVGHRDIAPLLNVTWGHGGCEALLLRDSSITVVCANTLRMALREDAQTRLVIRHTAGANVGLLASAIDAHVGVVAEFRAALESLDSTPCTEEGARALYNAHLFPETTPRASVTDALIAAFRHGAGNRGETMLDCLNGFTDYFTKDSVGGQDRVAKQVVSSEFGGGAAKKSAFLRMLVAS